MTEKERQKLTKWSRGRSLEHRRVVRAKIILMAAQGMHNQNIAQQLNISRPTVQLWRERFLHARLEGIRKDAPRPGRIPKLSATKEQQIVEATLYTTAAHATHWSVRSMAKAQGLSRMTIQRVWKKHNLKPHLIQSFKLSNDPRFFEKLQDVVGLYLHPPEKALVLSVDEKSQIQALDRTQPILPLRPGVPARQTHDYKRNGTTTLFAALNALDGTLIGKCMPRHRHQEFLKFLKLIDQETPEQLNLHLIIDNYGTHKHAAIQRYLKSHPRFHFHFTPTSSSWLNLVERWFAEITNKRIRRGTFKNVTQLVRAITDYIKHHNDDPTAFIWSAPVESIITKITKCKQALGTEH